MSSALITLNVVLLFQISLKLFQFCLDVFFNLFFMRPQMTGQQISPGSAQPIRQPQNPYQNNFQGMNPAMNPNFRPNNPYQYGYPNYNPAALQQQQQLLQQRQQMAHMHQMQALQQQQMQHQQQMRLSVPPNHPRFGTPVDQISPQIPVSQPQPRANPPQHSPAAIPPSSSTPNMRFPMQPQQPFTDTASPIPPSNSHNPVQSVKPAPSPVPAPSPAHTNPPTPSAQISPGVAKPTNISPKPGPNISPNQVSVFI